MKPQKLGHEAHCPKNYRPNPSVPDKCDCRYPELERLWKRETRLEEALQAIHDGIHTAPTQEGINQVKLGIRQVLLEFKTLMPDMLAKACEKDDKKRTGNEINLEGHVDDKGIRYLGSAHELTDGTWRCLAIVGEALCLIEVKITRAMEVADERSNDT